MSDTYGRKPFMLLSTVGLGLGFTITLLSRRVWPLLLAAAVDGSSSCMYSIAQACVTDCVGRGDKLSEALGLFQGLAIGMAFTIGMPIGGVLAVKKGPRFSVCVSVALCALNALLTGLVMPESLHRARRKPAVDFTMANPVGALRLLSRSPISLGISICYCLHWIANAGLQINFFNYTEKKLSWTPAQSGGGLALMGILVAVAPKLIIPRFGLRRALPLCLAVYAAAQLLIGAAPAGSGTAWVYTGLALSAVGSVAFPTTLALLNQQVGEDEGGAIQGAADTVKTFTTVCANPLMAACFGYFISAKAPKGLMGGSYYVGGGVAALAALVALVTITRYGHLADDEKPAAPAAAAVPPPHAPPEPAVELRVEPRQEPRDEAPPAPSAVFAEPLSSELRSTETEQ
ncbi:major facilitator superfamily domain-containing protein [Tribonema minus]|uniref:Major facilitator superfamily domain-containing protein n=1 Tax=Tribonema minus TaxID=303371 RepID=A0A836CIS1_9STRA|nr:major facilitator superfamily domain-containing protein [Tribonema minus]